MAQRLTFSAVWNRLTGQGGTADHGKPGEMAMRMPMPPHEIEALLDHAPLLRTAVEAMPEDIIRVWRTYPEGADGWTVAVEETDLIGTAERALVFAEAFGGAFILPRYDSSIVGVAALAAPFRAPPKGSLIGFKVLAPHQVSASSARQGGVQSNGLPMWYQLRDVTGQAIEVHHTWTMPVFGPSTYRTMAQQIANLHGILGQSRVDLIHDDFIRLSSGLQSVMHSLAKANIDVLKVAGLAEAIQKCSSTEQMQRALFGLLQTHAHTIQGANVYQPMVIDSAEALERHESKANPAPAIATLIDMFVAATRIPRTRLLGEQAKGLGNAGEADLTHYYDRCAAMRERRLTPVLNWADSLIAADRGLPDVMWEYAPLWTPSAKEQAETDKLNADVDTAYSALDIPFLRAKIARRIAPRYGFTPDELDAIDASEGPIDDTADGAMMPGG